MRAASLTSRCWVAALPLLASLPAAAHPAPQSVVRLEFTADSVSAECLLPVSELQYAFASPPTDADLPAYLLAHMAALGPDGRRWTIEILSVHSISYLDHPYFRATLRLLPPSGATTSPFVLVDDAVTHEVRNHVVMVVARRGDSDLAEVLGALQYPARQLIISQPTPLRVAR